LKKTAGSIAALLLRDCMPDPPEADAPDNSAGVSIFLFIFPPAACLHAGSSGG
jgi:hypothetical protein